VDRTAVADQTQRIGSRVRTYRMSEAGECSRVLSAQQLGYETSLPTEAGRKALEYYSTLEHVAANMIQSEGYQLQYVGKCPICSQNGEERQGIHVEIPHIMFNLIGHLDRRILIGSIWYPLEIKCLGRFSFDKFERKGFAEFPGYAAQEVCYLEAEQKPGVYAVLNRDTGKLNKYEVSHNGLNLNLFPKLEFTTTFTDIISKLEKVELFVRDNELPPGSDSESCRYCRYKFLCLKEVKEEPVTSDIVEVTLPSLVEAAQLWKEGKQYERMAEERVEQVKQVFVTHAKAGNDKFKVGGVSVSYRGQRSRKYLSETKLKELVDETILSKAYLEGKIFEDISIKPLKEEK